MDIWIAVLLVSFGLVLLVLEVFVFPGIGISGLLGIVSLGGGITIAFMLGTYQGVAVLGVSGMGVGVLTYLSIRLDTFSIMSLDTQIDSKVEVNHTQDLVADDQGTTISRLAPMGKARFGEFIVEVSSREGFIDENTQIKIDKIKDNTIFVSTLN